MSNRELKQLAKSLAHMALKKSMGGASLLGGVHHHKRHASKSMASRHRSHSRGAGFQYDVPTLYEPLEIGGRVHHRKKSVHHRGGASLSGGKRVRKTNRPLNAYQKFVKEFAMKNPNLIGKDLIRHAAQAYRM